MKTNESENSYKRIIGTHLLMTLIYWNIKKTLDVSFRYGFCTEFEWIRYTETYMKINKNLDPNKCAYCKKSFAF